jgi:hypothetical protein
MHSTCTLPFTNIEFSENELTTLDVAQLKRLLFECLDKCILPYIIEIFVSYSFSKGKVTQILM